VGLCVVGEVVGSSVAIVGLWVVGEWVVGL